MKQQLDNLKKQALEEIPASETAQSLEDLRVRYLGRKGLVTEILRGLSDIDPAERPALGKLANEVKNTITEAIEARKGEVGENGAAATKRSAALDLTLPGIRPRVGHKHVINQVMDEILDIFGELGYQVALGPDVETEYYNFDSLNTPEDHPARDTNDTFFIQPGVVLRTHTSPVQMRVMEKTKPPVAVVVPGRVYRVDYDASHSPMFFQIEGLLVDEGVNFSDLKGTLTHFVHRFFGKETKMRFRPHFFPFTEPSAEVDITCSVCKGAGCRVCKHSGWLEILGCGMVDPEVFRYAKYDYERFTGFAFGMGVDRIAILRHAVSTIHHFFENDLRVLEQF